MSLQRFFDAVEIFRLKEEIRETEKPAAPRTEIVVKKAVVIQPISKTKAKKLPQ